MLTEHQQLIKQKVLGYIEEKKIFILLAGSAGVGKTYMLEELIKSLLPTLRGDNVIHCTATTHNATGLIEEKMVNISSSRVLFKTIHSSLKLKRHIDFKTGKETYSPSFDPKYPPLKGVQYLIIDESSMLDKDRVEDIFEYASKYNVTVIFCGDEKQLPPIGEKISQVFTDDSIARAELTEIVRQGKDNPIIKISRNLEKIKSKEADFNSENATGYIYTEDDDKVVETLAHVNGSKDLKYVAYTNADVNALNNKVRKRIYGSPNKVEKGESIILKAPYKDKYVNNQEVKIRNIKVKNKTFKFMSKKSYNKNVAYTYDEIELKVYTINNTINVSMGTDTSWVGSPIEEEVDEIVIIHEDSEEDYANVIKHITSLCKLAEIPWTVLYAFKEQFADFTYSHALTVHRAQGQTFKQVIVNVQNINLNRDLEEKTKMFYTAVTRASDLVIFYKA